MKSNTIPCRKAFTGALLELAKVDDSIIVVTSDARGSVTLNNFADELPNQFVEVGIAEQNEVGMAAGISSMGYNVFVCAPACFLSARSLEQVKVDVAYSEKGVKLIGVSGGVSYGALGYSHHSLHDIAVMRSLAGLSVIIPADRHQMVAITKWLSKSEDAVYVRMGRAAVPDVYQEGDNCFSFGKANVLKQGTDLTIIATGEMVYNALEAAVILEEEKINARVLDMPTIKPMDKDAVIAAAAETGAILTMEEHSIHGGLGSSVAEIVTQSKIVPLSILGIPDEFTVVGSSKEVFAHYGLTGKGAAEKARELLKRKVVNHG